MKKSVSLIIAVIMAFSVVSAAMAESSETAYVTELTFSQNFESYAAESSQNTVVEIGDSREKALVIHRTDTSVDNIEKLVLDTAITQDIVELEFKLLPRETDGEKAEAYIQLFQGSSSARLNVKISCDNGDLTKYRIKVGSKEVIGKEDLYHLPKNFEDDGDNFTKENFNNIKMVMHRVNVDGATNSDLSKFYVYLNGELKGTYTFAEIGTGGIGYTYGKQVELVRIYQYRYDTGNPLDEVIYFDDIIVKGKTEVEYIPSELSMNFEAAMNYSEATPNLVVSNGTDSMYLEQNYRLSLVNAEDDTDITELSMSAAVKSDDGKATFSFNEEVNVNPGWYFADVQRYISGEIKGSGKQQKIYIATTEQLEALPGDFSQLPETEVEAQALVEYYLPCFLTEEEINTLLPKEDGALTQQAINNLGFITAYFKNSTVDYSEISDVQEDFLKAKGYLELKNAQSQEEIRTVLERGNYLTEYAESEVFIENEDAFFIHFETKRIDNENPLVSDEKINAALRYAMAMTSINAAERSGIEAIVGEYNEDVFGLDLSKVTSDNSDSLYSNLYNKAYTKVEDIRTDWNEALSDIPEEPVTPPELEEEDFTSGGSSSGKPSGGGSSGGGGGFFGGGSSNSVTVKKDDEELAPKIEPVEAAPSEDEKKELTDVYSHWAEEAISALYKEGIVTGYEDNTFRPEKTLTRAEFVVMLGRILPDTDSKEIAFSDVNDTDWFCKDVKKAVSYGIVQGADGKFMPYDYITREQLAVMIYRALKIEGASGNAAFSDYAEVSDYAKDAVNYLSANGIISGYEDNTIRPKNNTSRAEAAKLLYGLLNELTQD